MIKQEKTNCITTSNTLLRQSKDTKRKVQKEIVLEAFKRTPSTMLMVSVETGILRANICRYVAEWINSGDIFRFEIKLCKLSKHKAVYYTANKDLVFNPQYSLLWN